MIDNKGETAVMSRSSDRVTLTDVAKATGYTPNTVSRALKNKSDISVQTREHIQKVAREMGYVRNYIASSLRSGRTRTIALIAGTMSNPFYAILADLLQREAFRLGYSLMILCSQDEAEIEYNATEMALSRQADGVLIIPSSDPSPAMDMLRSSGIPYVMLSRKTSYAQDDCVLCDEEQGGYLAGKHLIDHGHRKLAMFSQNPVLYSTEMRHAGFLRACREAGIPESDCLFAEGRSEEEIISELRRLKAEQVTGIFSFCDVEAWAEITLLDRIGLRDAFSIVGFDNILGYINFPKPICSIDCSLQEEARLAIDLIRKRIHDRTMPPQQVVLPVSLVCRESCETPHS